MITRSADRDRSSQRSDAARLSPVYFLPRAVEIRRAAHHPVCRRGGRHHRPRWEARGASRYFFNHNGRAIRDFRGAWDTACKVAGVPALLFHDLRRSAVRNLVTAGVDQSVAMRITGHKAVSVFQRYRIVADDDVRAALARTEAANRAAMEANPDS